MLYENDTLPLPENSVQRKKKSMRNISSTVLLFPWKNYRMTYFWDLLIISISDPCLFDLFYFHKCYSLSCGILSSIKSSGLSQFLASVTSQLPIITFSLYTSTLLLSPSCSFSLMSGYFCLLWYSCSCAFRPSPCECTWRPWTRDQDKYSREM